MTKNSTHSTPTTSSASSTRAGDARRPRGRHCGGRRGRRDDTSRMWLRVRVVDRAVVGRTRRRAPRAATTETSRSKSTNASSTASLAADRLPGGRGVGERRDLRLALAVVAPAGRLEHGRRAQLRQRRRPARPASAPRETASPGMPALARNVFSRRRCCVVCSTVAAGPHRREARRRRSAVAAGTFSNSNVTTSTLAGEAAHRVEIVVGGRDLEVGDLAGRRVVVGREACGRGSPCGARRWRTCGRAGRCPARRWSRPGRIGPFTAAVSPSTCPRLLARETSRSFSRSSGRAAGQDAHGQQRRVGRAGLADGQRAHRARRRASARSTAANRALAAPGSAPARRAPAARSAAHHARQVGRAAGAGDDHLAGRAPSAVAAYSRIQLGRAVGRDDAALVRHAEAGRASRRRGASSPSRTCCP